MFDTNEKHVNYDFSFFSMLRVLYNITVIREVVISGCEKISCSFTRNIYLPNKVKENYIE